MNKRQRLDLALVERGLAASREKARALILAGRRARRWRDGDARRRARRGRRGDRDRAAGAVRLRGGEKLDHALGRFGIDVAGLVAVDVGASTGGFTDCLLQRGAARVYAIDVGHGQLDMRLRADERVVVMERTHITRRSRRCRSSRTSRRSTRRSSR